MRQKSASAAPSRSNKSVASGAGSRQSYQKSNYSSRKAPSQGNGSQKSFGSIIRTDKSASVAAGSRKSGAGTRDIGAEGTFVGSFDQERSDYALVLRSKMGIPLAPEQSKLYKPEPRDITASGNPRSS